MKKILNIKTIAMVFGLLTIFAWTSCGQTNEKPVKENQTSVKMDKPDELGMSQKTYDEAVQKKGIEAVEKEKSALLAEASDAIGETYDALAAIEKGDKKTAIKHLETATGKMEILLARDPNLDLVPLDAKVETHDLVADLEAIKAIKKIAEKAMKDGHFQAVREELENLASEIQVTTVSLPLTTFPAAAVAAANLLEKDDTTAAKLVLYDALNTLVIERQRIPLPVLRAEVLVEEAMSQDAKTEDKKAEVLQLLESADYQLTMAEELGYGKKDREYAALHKSIKELKKSVEDEGDSQGLFQGLRDKLAAFKKRLFS
ncbi:MAG TPA: YfdX family protein [Bacteroidetes bacterium]|nr:YfdX family protein [Bacteroidota bacterium]